MHEVSTRDAIEMVEVRLSEALQAFAVLDTINLAYMDDSLEHLRGSISERGAFWHPITLGLQTVVLTSIFALLDSTRKDCATMYYLIGCLSPEQATRVPQNFSKELDEVRDRYKTYRHKLFAHNDLRRLQVAEAFDRDGFTWSSVKQDLLTLDFSAKVLQHILANMPPPSREAARRMLYSFNISRAHAVAHTRAITREIGGPLSSVAEDPSALFEG